MIPLYLHSYIRVIVMDNKNVLYLKSISDLLDYKFYIPDYQRGYRWTSTQVIQLLEDVWNFAQNPPAKKNNNSNPFYCLQPIVVKNIERDGETVWEVIDGQQRLTTIILILHYFNEMWIGKKKIKEPVIEYETRKDSSDYILHIEIKDDSPDVSTIDNIKRALELIKADSGNYNSYDNIDFFHIINAYKAIHYWVLRKGDNLDENKLQSVFQKDTKVIWYEVDDSGYDNSIDIFTRLNIGKIPLTNSELIKAMFLMKGNFSAERAALKQIQIASEWDIIENTLQDDRFWYFIYNTSNSIKYDNRIEYIFDLMKNKTVNHEFYHTFNGFYADFESNKKNGKADVEKLWLNVKKYFLTFEEWYKDYELYHYIGFLIDCGVSIVELKNISENKDKISFKEYLKNRIKESIKSDVNIDEIDFNKHKSTIKKILLLFNIVTVLQTQKSDMRFPFYKYKTENWDIEHVCSQTDKEIRSEKNKKEWIDDMLDYFVGSTNEEIIEQWIKDDTKENRELCQELYSAKSLSGSELANKFNELFSIINKMFKEDNLVDNKDNICNLALLDSETNRSYGNAFFPVKRKRIIYNDSKGIFVPISTKNLFLKYYSNQSDNIMYWSKDDANDYLNAIKSVLKEFLQ